jgi:hypothetical protein
MCGRRLIDKSFFTLMQHWSGAVMCPASHDGVSVKSECWRTVIQGGALISAGFPANLTSGGS